MKGVEQAGLAKGQVLFHTAPKLAVDPAQVISVRVMRGRTVSRGHTDALYLRPMKPTQRGMGRGEPMVTATKAASMKSPRSQIKRRKQVVRGRLGFGRKSRRHPGWHTWGQQGSQLEVSERTGKHVIVSLAGPKWDAEGRAERNWGGVAPARCR